MNHQWLIRAPRHYVILVSLFTVLTVSASAELSSSGLVEARQEMVDSILEFLLIGILLILLASVILIKYRSLRHKGRRQSADEREFAHLIEESVRAGQATAEKPTS